MAQETESAERIISPYEADARASRKRDTEWVGYKVHLTETCGEEDAVHLIVQAEITPATEQDVEETMPRLARFASPRPGARGAAGREFLCQWRGARQARRSGD